MLKYIDTENFKEEVVKSKRPVLLLCMPLNGEFKCQIKIVKSIAAIFAKKIKFCVLKDDFIETFMRRFRVVGTPTYLLFVDGKEKARMLGLAEQQPLVSFLSSNSSD